MSLTRRSLPVSKLCNCYLGRQSRMDFADRRPHESEWLSTRSSNYSLTMILPASCSCNHYSLARFPTVTEICHAMCIRSPPLLSHRSEEHTSELQSLMRISYADFCLTQNTDKEQIHTTTH